MKKWIKLLRVKHYLKNFIIFLPIVFSGEIMNRTKLIYSIVAFTIFSLLASIVYIINDVKDVESDRMHPRKCKRPIASGDISKKKALVGAAVLLFIVVFGQWYLDYSQGTYSFIILIVYFLLNIVYSVFKLKNIPLLDIVILVSGFALRLKYGSMVTGIVISSILYLVIIVGASYLGFGKRRNEIIKEGNQGRNVLKYYSKEFLDKSMYSCMTLVIVFYALWCLEKDRVEAEGYSIWTLPLLMLTIWRYNMLMEGDSSGDPVDVILGDKILLVIGLCFVVAVVLVVYI